MKTLRVVPFRLGRRAVLQGIAGVAVALPLLDVMERATSAQTQTSAPPKRFIVMFSQSGTVYDRWTPSGAGTSFELSDILAPLEPYKSDLVVVGGLTNEAGQNGPGDDHSKGMGTILTGTPLVGTGRFGAGGISLDQEIANNIGGTTRFKSIETGVLSGSGSITNYLSHAGANQEIPAENDPARVYDRIFGDFVGGAQPSDLLAQRQSILDTVADSYSSLLPRVSLEDRSKLQSHLDNIRGIEQRLLAEPAAASAESGCTAPTAVTIDSRQNDNFPAIGQAQLDLIHLAQACDLTRVSTIQFSRESADPRFTWLGLTRGHHAISHDADSVSQSVEQLVSINNWHAQQYAYMLDKLVNTQEGGVRQLDNTVFLWVNGLAKGNNHSHAPHPNVLAGSAGGAIATGQYLNFTDRTTTNDLYVAILNALDIPATSFGDYSTGPLPGILA